MSALAPTLAGQRRPPEVATRMVPLAAGAAAAGSLLVALAASTWLVLAAAQRPSVLSPPTVRAGVHPWLLGPLSGALPHLTTDVTRLHADLTIALAVLFVAWLVAWVTAPVLPVWIVGAAVALAQLVFFLGPPQPLTDIFNYIEYGRMAAHGLNPYTHIPLSASHDAAYALSNWHHLRDPYGPLFTLLTAPMSVLPLPIAYWLWKAVVVACALAALALVWWLARRLGCSPQRALACAGLCPVTLAVGVGGFHNDMPAVMCMLAAVACMLRGFDDAAASPGAWDAGAGALIVGAAALKPSFAFVAPLIVLGTYRRLAAAAGAGAAALAIGAVILLIFGGALPDIGQQDRLVNPLSVPNVIGTLVGHGGADAGVRAAGRYALAVVVLVAAGAVAWRRRWALPAIGIVLLASVVSLSWVMPWYLAWSLPFAALRTPRVLAPLAVAACLWLGVAGVPQMPSLLHEIGWYPTRSATGHANREYEIRLVR